MQQKLYLILLCAALALMMGCTGSETPKYSSETDSIYKWENIRQSIMERPNVYDAAAIDYRLSELLPDDIGAILQGRSSDKLQNVLCPDADDNVFIFWSGHGSCGSMDFGGTQSMSYDRLRTLLSDTPHRNC